MKKRFFVTLLALLMLMMSLASAETAATTATPEAGTEEKDINYFLTIATTDIFGKEFDAASLEGKPILINIWADWCSPCLGELPTLDKLAKQYADKMTIIGLLPEGVNLNSEKTGLVLNQETIDAAKKVYEAKGLSFTTLVPDELLHTFMYYTQLQAFPTTWFIDQNGIIRRIETGAHDEASWIKMIDEMLIEMEKEPVKTDAS